MEIDENDLSENLIPVLELCPQFNNSYLGLDCTTALLHQVEECAVTPSRGKLGLHTI